MRADSADGAWAPGQETPAAHLLCQRKHWKWDAANQPDGSKSRATPPSSRRHLTQLWRVTIQTPRSWFPTVLNKTLCFWIKLCVSNRAARLRQQPDLRIPKISPEDINPLLQQPGWPLLSLINAFCGFELASPQVVLIFQEFLGDFSPVRGVVIGCYTSDLLHLCWIAWFIFKSSFKGRVHSGLKEWHLFLSKAIWTAVWMHRWKSDARMSWGALWQCLNNTKLFRSLDLGPTVPLNESQTIMDLDCSVHEHSSVHVSVWSS